MMPHYKYFHLDTEETRMENAVLTLSMLGWGGGGGGQVFLDEYFKRGQMLGRPGSVFSALIMQAVSEKAGQRGCSTVKPPCGSGGGGGAKGNCLCYQDKSNRQTNPL